MAHTLGCDDGDDTHHHQQDQTFNTHTVSQQQIKEVAQDSLPMCLKHAHTDLVIKIFGAITPKALLLSYFCNCTYIDNQ